MSAGRDRLKQLTKNSLHIVAFSMFKLASTRPCLSEGTVVLFLVFNLVVLQNCFDLGFKLAKYLFIEALNSFKAYSSQIYIYLLKPGLLLFGAVYTIFLSFSKLTILLWKSREDFVSYLKDAFFHYSHKSLFPPGPCLVYT